jgi:hypothetical protein
MTKLKAVLFVLLTATAVGTLAQGTLLFIYQINHVQLQEQIQNAEKWRDFMLINDLPLGVAYFEGQRSVLVAQYESLGLKYEPRKPRGE